MYILNEVEPQAVDPNNAEDPAVAPVDPAAAPADPAAPVDPDAAPDAVANNPADAPANADDAQDAAAPDNAENVQVVNVDPADPDAVIIVT